MRRLWTALTRPRGGRRHRRSGVALLMAVGILMITTVLVTEVTYSSRVRLLVSTHQRDKVQAYWLAKSGVYIYHLILVADRYVEDQLGEYLGVSLSLWEMVPIINTGLMKMIFAYEDSSSNISQEEVDNFLLTGQASEEITDMAVEEAGGLFDDKSFLDFDGEFSATLVDEDSKIPVNNFSELETGTTYADFLEDPTYKALYGLFSTEENEEWFYDRDIDRTELIANLADWIDGDTTRLTSDGGYEDSLYDDLDDPYLTKNAPLDSVEEIRLVDGWDDEVFGKFGDQLTIWGRGKLNVHSVSDDMLKGILLTIDETLTESQLEYYLENYEEYVDTYGNFERKKYWVEYWEDQGFEIPDDVSTMLRVKSRTFTVKSTGLVNDSSVTISAIIDTSSNKYGDVLFWKVE